MFEQDYLMKLLLAFYQAMFKSLRRVTDEDEDPKEAADTLDEVVGNAVGMDGASLLSLTPESVVGVLQVSGTDPRVTTPTHLVSPVSDTRTTAANCAR